MSLTTRVLIGLAGGFAAGLLLSSAAPAWSGPIANAIAPVGTIFVNLIRMTVLPLVTSMLVASVGSMAASDVLGRVGARAAVLAVTLVVVAALLSVAVAQPVLARVRIDQSAALALRGAASTPPLASSQTPGVAQWFVDLVPVNPIKAAADGAILPVIVFAVLFALALGRVEASRRDAVLNVARGIADASQRLVAAILDLAPFGVFALAVPLASRLGLAAAGAVVVYLVLVVSLTVAVGLFVLYPAAAVFGGMRPRDFASFCAPSQAVAFASRSSLAALPAMVESAECIHMPAVVVGFFLPLAASVFRVGAAVAQTVGVLFLARLYAVPLSPAQLASVVITIVLTTFAVPGIPGGSIIAMVPVLNAVNLPIEGIGVLLAVDTIPDMFRTTENVTGTMTLAAMLRTRR